VKLPLAFAVIALITLSGCDRALKFADSVRAKERSGDGMPAYPGPLVVEIPDGGYETFLQQSGRLVVVDFYANWSGPSRQFAALCDKIAAERGGVVIVGKVNIEQFRELAKREGVKNVPDVRIYREGHLLERFVGLPDEAEMRQKVLKHAKGLSLAALLARENTQHQATTQPMAKDWMPPGLRRR
jgi:thioredoxin 1